MPSRKLEGNRDSVRAEAKREPRRLNPARLHVLGGGVEFHLGRRGPEAERSDRTRRHLLVKPEEKIIGIQDTDPVRRQPGQQFGLRLGDGLAAAETPHVGLTDVRDDADVGFAQLGEIRDLTGPAHGQLEHAEAMFGGQLQQQSGNADLVVLGPRRDKRQALKTNDSSQHVLRRRLARAAGDGEEGGCGFASRDFTETPVRQKRILNHDARARHLNGPRHEHGRSALLTSRLHVVVAVVSLTLESDEQLPRPQSTRIGRDPRDGRLRVPALQLSCASPRDISECSLFHLKLRLVLLL